MITPIPSAEDILAEIKARLTGETQNEDRSGRTPLIALAEALRNRPPDDKVRERYEWAGARIIAGAAEFTANNLRQFLRFLDIGNIFSPSILDAAKRLLSTKSPEETNVEKRAELIRWLTEHGDKIPPSALEKEESMKMAFPWLWIDAMIVSDRDSAKQAITEILKKQRSAGDLLVRLPYLWAKCELSPDDFRDWIQALPGNEATKLREWLARRGLSQNGVKGVPTLEEEDRKFLFEAIKNERFPLITR